MSSEFAPTPPQPPEQSSEAPVLIDTGAEAQPQPIANVEYLRLEAMNAEAYRNMLKGAKQQRATQRKESVGSFFENHKTAKIARGTGRFAVKLAAHVGAGLTGGYVAEKNKFHTAQKASNVYYGARLKRAKRKARHNTQAT